MSDSTKKFWKWIQTLSTRLGWIVVILTAFYTAFSYLDRLSLLESENAKQHTAMMSRLDNLTGDVGEIRGMLKGTRVASNEMGLAKHDQK